MQLRMILTALALVLAPAAQAQGSGDDQVLEMAQAFRQGNKARLAQLLPPLRGHALECRKSRTF